VSHFEKLLVWQKAHQLTLLTYKTTHYFPKEEKFGLISQMRRAAVSIGSCLAEGYKKKSYKEKAHYYSMSETSLEELKYQYLLAKDLGYLKEERYLEIRKDFEEVGKMLNGLIRSCISL